MEKIWLKQYPEGVPETIDVTAYRSLQDLFLRSVRTSAIHPHFLIWIKR